MGDMGDIKAFSAPGKALVAGGYLVLDPNYKAYVTALSSRMHALVQGRSTQRKSTIKVSSPQFKAGEWSYVIGNNHIEPPSEVNGKRNPFLEATISSVLCYVQPKTAFDIEVTIFSDAGYHSQADTVKKSTSSGRSFLYHSQPIDKVAKTGMGSSAGLVAVVTSALISYFTGKTDLQLVHNVAQVAHCFAQKKVGSGFDVATAVYGSIIYRRFQPDIFNNVLLHDVFANMENESARASYLAAFSNLVGSKWNFESTRCALPPRVRLIMGDVKGGSETPRLVGKVLEWRKSNPEKSFELYSALDRANSQLIEALANLHNISEADPKHYTEMVEYFGSRSISSVSSYLEVQPERKLRLTPMLQLIESFACIRSHLRNLTRFSGADIEPKSQTILLNSCNTLKGCLGGVVPGAGGFDAICLLVVEDSIHQMLETTKSDERFRSVTWLQLHEVDKGIIEESVEDYQELLA